MKKLIKLSKPANQCRGCGTLSNVLSNIDLEHFGYELVERDIIENPRLVEVYGITSVPVLIICDEHGRERKRVIGAVPEDVIIELLGGVAP